MSDARPGRLRQPALTLLGIGLAALLGITFLVALSDARAQEVAPSHAPGPTQDEPATSAADQSTRGAEIYQFACATCHGLTGLGFAEAVSVFPEDHRQCTRCHQPQNSATMPGSQVGLSTMAFSLGEPPPLAERDRLQRYQTAGALYHYVRAAMPRWAPGSLADDAYLDVTSHLLRLVGLLTEDQMLSFEQLDLGLAE